MRRDKRRVRMTEKKNITKFVLIIDQIILTFYIYIYINLHITILYGLDMIMKRITVDFYSNQFRRENDLNFKI